MSLLQQWGVLNTTNGGGRPSTVVECPEANHATKPLAGIQQQSDTAQEEPQASTNEPDESTLGPLLLDLIHLGTSIRKMTARADLNNFDGLEKLLRAAVRRTGGDLSQIDEYELAVHIPGRSEPVTTVVVAA